MGKYCRYVMSEVAGEQVVYDEMSNSRCRVLVLLTAVFLSKTICDQLSNLRSIHANGVSDRPLCQQADLVFLLVGRFPF